MKQTLSIALTALALTLTACGGGDTNSTPNPQPDPTPGGWGDTSTITAAQLKGCPVTDTTEQGKIDPAVNTCTKGTLGGITQVGSSQKCSLTMDGNGTLTFNSPTFSKSITLKSPTYVYYGHRIDSGAHTLMYSLEDRATDTTGKVNIGFAFYETITSPSLPNLTITVQDGQQTAACFTRI
ncbi:hypothetical protein ACFOPQ_09640 [Deinococcus antarcticus]|uniref:Uncharacterized protein n=1 Tax=Deinococcus antarcticus TaxID=1298767 RepID=A0ABV8A5P5_9DEIO